MSDKYIAMARKKNRQTTGSSNSKYSVVANSPWDDGAVEAYHHSYICHGHLLNYLRRKVYAVVEDMSRHKNIADQEALKMYLQYILNDHPLSDVAMIKSVPNALRYGIPLDVNKYGSFAIRAFAITLRRAMENHTSLSLFRSLVEGGVHPHAAFIIFDQTRTTNGEPVYQGGYDHSLTNSYMKWEELVSFMNKKYSQSKRAKVFADKTTPVTRIQNTVAKKGGVSVFDTLKPFTVEVGTGWSKYVKIIPPTPENCSLIASTLNPFFES